MRNLASGRSCWYLPKNYDTESIEYNELSKKSTAPLPHSQNLLQLQAEHSWDYRNKRKAPPRLRAARLGVPNGMSSSSNFLFSSFSCLLDTKGTGCGDPGSKRLRSFVVASPREGKNSSTTKGVENV